LVADVEHHNSARRHGVIFLHVGMQKGRSVGSSTTSHNRLVPSGEVSSEREGSHARMLGTRTREKDLILIYMLCLGSSSRKQIEDHVVFWFLWESFR
jgi:hypothetical protein